MFLFDYKGGAGFYWSMGFNMIMTIAFIPFLLYHTRLYLIYFSAYYAILSVRYNPLLIM